MRLGLAPIGDPRWQAGVGYVANLRQALGTRDDVEVVDLPVAPARGGLAGRRPGWDRALGRAAAAVGADALLLGEPTKRVPGPVRVLGWLPDLQHRALPQFFSTLEARSRDVLYRQVGWAADRLLVPSVQVHRELQAWRPGLAARAVALHPTSRPDESTFTVDARAVARRHGIDGPFAYLPGQTWAHKGHADALRALARVPDLLLVCSGREDDYRRPEHPARLRDVAEESGVADRVRWLGSIEHDDVLQLMRASHAVVNPSHYEGFGMTVDEARAVGARLVLSDLPAHREHPVEATWFPPGDVAALAAAFADLRDVDGGPDAAAEERAREQSLALQRRYAAGLRDLVAGA